ncbi:MFS transporter [Fulvivirga lutimaris]|uniref:MFS transporter n=1 Tax=Fulvivirga lutimaris TaxID=1819566 RepID=UPI0012BD19A8|nr:MFS transporter [Fulvivirga lutimaris]MTI40549.1 MFS transporter [Fulvivirga lutimaris]
MSSFLFFASFNMIIPELPAYLTKLGGEDYKGFIISLFTLTAGLSRPFSGKLTDKIGRIPVMVFGASVCFALGFIYPFVTTIFGFFALRLVHGFSTGFKPTGTVAYVADIVPASKRGEAMGLSSFFGTIGMATGATIGSAIAKSYSTDVMFGVSSAFAILSIIILAGMKETLENREKFKLSHLSISRNEIFEKSAIPPSIVMFLTIFSFGIILTVIPDFGVHLGLDKSESAWLNKGTFMTVFIFASLVVRIFAGKISDKFGREPVLKLAAVLYTTGMLTVGFADNINMFFTGAVIYGLAVGMNSPTLFAWTADLSDEKNRGKAMATTFIALEAGIMLGAILSGWTFSNNPENFPITFGMGAGLALVALTYLISRRKKISASLSHE